MQVNIEQVLQLIASPWYEAEETDDFNRFRELDSGVFRENDRIVGLKIDNLSPPLTYEEVIELLKVYAKDLKYLGIGGTIDCAAIEQIDFSNVTHLWLRSQSVYYLDTCIEQFPNLQFLHLSASNLRTLNGIEKAENLETVILDIGRWNSFRPLKRLKKLKRLFIEFFALDKFLRELPKVEELGIKGNSVISVPLDVLKSAKKLYLFDLDVDTSNFKQVANWLKKLDNIVEFSVGLDNSIRLNLMLEAIEHLKDLETLEILGNYEVTENPSSDDLENITNFKNLKQLALQDILPNDLSPIGELEQLESLTLWSTTGFNLFRSINDTRSHSLDFIAKLPKLKYLILNEATVEIKNLDFLRNLKHLKQLEIINSEIEDFSGIRYATNLRRLKLYEIISSSLNGIENLQNLEKLVIEMSSINDLSSISKLKNLKFLELQFVKGEDFGFIQHLHSLKHLFILDGLLYNFGILENLSNLTSFSFEQEQYNFDVVNVQTLTKLRNLRFLSLQSNDLNYYYHLPLNELKQLWSLSIDRIFEIEQLKDLTQLRELDINTEVEDLSFLTGMQNLVSLKLKLTPQVDLTPLTKLKNLVALTLNNVSVQQLDPILQLKNLQNLIIYDLTGISKNRKIIRELKQKIPNTFIHTKR